MYIYLQVAYIHITHHIHILLQYEPKDNIPMILIIFYFLIVESGYPCLQAGGCGSIHVKKMVLNVQKSTFLLIPLICIGRRHFAVVRGKNSSSWKIISKLTFFVSF